MSNASYEIHFAIDHMEETFKKKIGWLDFLISVSRFGKSTFQIIKISAWKETILESSEPRIWKIIF